MCESVSNADSVRVSVGIGNNDTISKCFDVATDLIVSQRMAVLLRQRGRRGLRLLHLVSQRGCTVAGGSNNVQVLCHFVPHFKIE